MPASTSPGEAVLQAWFALKPQGFTASTDVLISLLPQIEVILFGKAASADRSVQSLFNISDCSLSTFVSLLKPSLLNQRAGQVNFIDFWTACGRAFRLVDAALCSGLFNELELLRDDVLSKLHGVQTPRLSTVGIPSDLLLESMNRLYLSSVRPSFWRSAMMALDTFRHVSFCTLYQFTNMSMSWLYEASLWEGSKQGSQAACRRNSSGLLCAPMPLEVLRAAHSPRAARARSPPPALHTQSSSALSTRVSQNGSKSPTSSTASTRSTSRDGQDTPPETPSQGSRTLAKSASTNSFINPFAWAFQYKGIPVYLHIYDATREESIQLLNSVLASEYSPVKVGGAFHTGVEVNGLEWSFGFESNISKCGLLCTMPMQHPKHHYRETINCGRTNLSETEISAVIAELVEEYPGNDYHILSRNCNHFADDFCQRLGVRGVPSWAKRFADIGVSLCSMVPKVVTDQIYGFAHLTSPREQKYQVPLDTSYTFDAGVVQWDPLDSTLTAHGAMRHGH